MDKKKNYRINLLPLRIGVGIILLNKKNRVFVGKRIDNPNFFWQMPQGGVNKKEKMYNAAIRELKEETGIQTIKLIKEIDYWLQYDLPKNLLGKIWKGRYRGQKQRWFIMRFLGKNTEINVNTEKPEFLDWKWIKSSQLPNIAVKFKIKMYRKLSSELKFLNLSS